MTSADTSCEDGDPRRPELLAPAGDVSAAMAALAYGADAVYLGLRKFSARADATNFSPTELADLVGYAHALRGRKRNVYLAVNTVVLTAELPELIETLASAEEAGVDAVIVQDLGALKLVRDHFPQLRLHASTQMAVHNRDGAEALRQLGIVRAILARELTLAEIADIASIPDLETEVFIHGALCYGYSGLCLLSSHLRGTSGNRGDCAYPCRDTFRIEGASGGPAELTRSATLCALSMKDLALDQMLPQLQAAGVSALKIEGRKKSALYVAAATNYYRELLDGGLQDTRQRQLLAADLQTVFSRPSTELFVRDRHSADVIAPHIAGHRGTPVGEVQDVLTDQGRNPDRLRFVLRNRPLERHDGLQIDLPERKWPFGFPVLRLRVVNAAGGQRTTDIFCAEPGMLVEVELPPQHPSIAPGSKVYCSASLAVKRRYHWEQLRPGSSFVRHPVKFRVTLTPTGILVNASVSSTRADESNAIEVEHFTATLLSPARTNPVTEQAVEKAFGKLVESRLSLAGATLHNPQNLFVPVSLLNECRRKIVTQIEQKLDLRHTARLDSLKRAVCHPPPIHSPTALPNPLWTIKIENPALLDKFVNEDRQDLGEVIVCVERAGLPALLLGLHALAAKFGNERIRIALPVISRAWEREHLEAIVHGLMHDGWRKWEASNLSAWTTLQAGMNFCPQTDLDLTADWPLYALNPLAARQLQQMGARHFVLSPEDGAANMRSLLDQFGDAAEVIVYQDTPLCVSATCIQANALDTCSGTKTCGFKQLQLRSGRSEELLAINRGCRTVILSQAPFCLGGRLANLRDLGARTLRAEFCLRTYTPTNVRDIWRKLRANESIPNTHSGNFKAGFARAQLE